MDEQATRNMDVSPKQTPRRRRLFRFSLSSVFLFVGVSAILTDWVIDRVKRHARQIEVASQLVNLTLRDQPRGLTDRLSIGRSGGNHVTLEPAQGWEKLLAVWFGTPYESDVVGVSVYGVQKEWDDVLAMIKSFPKLEQIELARCKVSDEVLNDLAGLDVATVWFTSTDVSKDRAMALKEALPHAKISAWHDDHYGMMKTHKGKVLDFELQ